MGIRASKYTTVYADFRGGKQIHYVRLAPLETQQFPHGIALATTFDTKSAASGFADLVDAYIEQAIMARSNA